MNKTKKSRKSKKTENIIINTLNELGYSDVRNIDKVLNLPIFPLPLKKEMIEYILKLDLNVAQKIFFLDTIDKALIMKKIECGLTKEERYAFLKDIFEELKAEIDDEHPLFLWTIKEYFETAIKNGLIEFDILCPKIVGFDILETIKEIFYSDKIRDYKTKEITLERTKESLLNLKTNYFKNIVLNFNIIGLKSKLKGDCSDCNIDINELLILQFEYKNITLDEALKYYRRLFDIGIGPNVRFEENKSFIQVIMEKHWYGNDMKFIYKLIELAIKYHFDVNEQPTLLPTLLNKNIDVYKFLKLFMDNGYDINKDNLDFFETIDKINTGYINNTNQMYKIAKFKSVIDILKLKLNEKGYEVVDNFEEVLLSMHEEFTDILFMLCSYYRYIISAIGDEWSTKIIDNRASYINDYDGPISVNETITGLRLFLDEIFSKINNDVEDCKQLSLKYEQ